MVHLSPITTKRYGENDEHLSSESSRRLSFAIAATAESLSRLQLTVRLRSLPLPARILFAIAFVGVNACNSNQTPD